MTIESNSEKKSDVVSVSVPNEMKLWLDKHPKVNRSKLFQDAVNNLRFPKQKKLSPSLVLICFMGIIGGIVITMMAGFLFNMFQAINSELWWIFPIGLLLLGLALSLGSLLTIMKAKNDNKKLIKSEMVARNV